MERPVGAPRTPSSPANKKGIDGCCAAMRRLLEKLIAEDDYNGAGQLTVYFQNSTIQSYRASKVLPA